MTKFSFLPKDDAKQALRIRRYLLASAFSLVYLFVLSVYYLQGIIGKRTLIEVNVIVIFLVTFFYVALRTGLNLRMRDPSLTAAQTLSAVFTMLYVLYQAPATRAAFASFLFVALMFGMLRLSTRQLSIVAAISLAGLAAIIALRVHREEASGVVREDFMHWIALGRRRKSLRAPAHQA